MPATAGRLSREETLAISHSSFKPAETDPAGLLKSAEHNVALSLVPTETTNAAQYSWEDQPEEIPFAIEQHRLDGPEAGMNLRERSFGWSAKLIIAAGVLVGAFGGISYFVFAPGNEVTVGPTSSTTQETVVINRSEPAGPSPSVTSVPPQDTLASAAAALRPNLPTERPGATPLGTVWPEPSFQAPRPPSPIVQDSSRPSPVGSRDRVASLSRPTPDNAAIRQPAVGTQSPQFVFLQRPGVNLRSTPSLTGAVVGAAPKGTRFEVLNHSGDEWVQVKASNWKGWINARFVGPNAP